MGTSAKITVKGVDKVCIYFHYDGYESHTGFFLASLAIDFVKNRGDDENYFFAQILRQSMIFDMMYENSHKEDLHAVMHDMSRKFTSYGVFNSDEIDANCDYEIDLSSKTINGHDFEEFKTKCKGE